MIDGDSALSVAPLSAYSREVLIELVGLHARILRRMPWVQTLLALGVALFVARYVPTTAFGTWCVLSVGVEWLRARYAAAVLRRGAAIDPRKVHQAFVAWALVAGGVVGLGAAVCFPLLPIAAQAMLGVVLFAMPAAGVAVSQSSRYIVAAYSTSILFPAAASWAVVHPDQSIAVVSLTLLYCGLIILVAVEGDQLLLRSVIIRHERDRLVRDLEQRNDDVRAAMERAEQAAQSRSRVLATASHDLRQPLHALSIYSAVLAANPHTDQLREVSANIDQIVRSLGSLLHGLLDLSRLTVGHFVPERKIVALDEVVAAVCAEYRRSANDKNLQLNTRIPPLRVLGDAVAIGRIVRNLLDNAIKYTNSGSVSVWAQVAGESGDASVALSVVDTGTGIPLDEQARIFEEFYQLDNPGRDRSRGVGLGLAIVKRLCELIDAQIRVESTPGVGTRFELRLDGVVSDALQTRVEAPGANSASSILRAGDGHAAATAHHHFPGRKVYLIDDELDILRSTRALLALWGMSVSIAASAAQAEQLFAANGRPELLITDLRLRGAESGVELASRLQKTFGAFPTLIITGEVAAAGLRRIDAIEAVLLYKPLTAEALSLAIGAALDNEDGHPDSDAMSIRTSSRKDGQMKRAAAAVTASRKPLPGRGQIEP
jgi:two-component system, sensor histidine kinase